MTATDTLHVGAERAPFVMLPRWLLHHREMSDGAKVLYGMLHDLVAGREGPTRPVTRGQLAACCGVSVATVDRRLAELVAAGAVDKHAQFETHQGQLANVYWVRLSPPAANLQPPVDSAVDGGCIPAAPPAARLEPALPQACGAGGRTDAPPIMKEQKQELPPQPPRRAGGRSDVAHDPAGPRPRRMSGLTLRAVGANPRADAERAAAAVEAEVAARRTAEMEAERAARRAAEEAGLAEAARLAAEALALSAALNDGLLGAVVARASEGLAGPLARSPLAVTRAVISWCRGAAASRPGPLVPAVTAALTLDSDPVLGLAAPLELAAPAVGTVDLRTRIAGLLRCDPLPDQLGG